MQNSPSSCCSSQEPSNGENRRGFFGQAAAIACGAAAIAAPAIAGVVAFLNPLGQKSQGGRFLRLASLDAIPEDGTPLNIPIIADRIDTWSRFPKEPIGAVYLERIAGGGVMALQVICPHAGCSIAFDATARKFFCPCHAANFNMAGERTDATSPSPRNMDSLDVEIRNQTEVWVKFQTFGLGTAKKAAQG